MAILSRGLGRLMAVQSGTGVEKSYELESVEAGSAKDNRTVYLACARRGAPPQPVY